MRVRLGVQGIVQGVGFRPFCHSLASRCQLTGLVGNDSTGVFVELEGDPEAIERFRTVLLTDPPPLAVIEHVDCVEIPDTGAVGFVIVDSRAGPVRDTLISPDTATCADCLRELEDPGDRRYRHPFVNCTNCGPRFTIVTDVPYDRPNTTMAGFEMCPACRSEYDDPADRRFHAQPVCCPSCGPTLTLIGPTGLMRGDPLAGAVGLLRDGHVVAVKGIGGYHLAVDAASERAVARLRGRKHREDKPFALLVADLTVAERICEVDEAARRALSSPRRPIVLLPRRPGRTTVAHSVAPGNSHLGIVLPYSAMHQRLAEMFSTPIVLTSGNISDEPIAFIDSDARERLSTVADAFLTHDRPIRTRTDDSVIRIFRGAEYPIRRSRGHVPQPLLLRDPLPRPVLACGAELKSTFCLGRGRHAFVSHHIGDLENFETMRAYVDGIAHLQRLFDIEPQLVVHDLHPEYLSTKHAHGMPGVDLLGVQHHHAHIASCLADNGVAGPVIGVAFDGLGYGPDATIWGGEFLRADLTGFERLGQLEAVPMPGGTAAIKQPWRMAVSYLDAAFADRPPPLDIVDRNRTDWNGVLSIARSGLNSPVTSSAGRLFDAVAALLGVRDRVNYEGQAAIELEQHTDRTHRDRYPVHIDDADRFRVLGTDLIRAAVADVCAGIDAPRIAARFHNGLVDAVARACDLAADRTGLRTVALSGGVFQNVLLLERVVDALEARGFEVLVHSRVPCNDGGISLGQLVVAAALDRIH